MYFKFLPGNEIRSSGGIESQSLVLAPLCRLKPKLLRSGFVVKAYVLLIEIRLSDEEVKPDSPLMFFHKRWLIPGSGFSVTVPYPTFITHTLYHTSIHSFLTSTYRYTSPYNVACQCGVKNRKWVTLSPVYALK